MISDDNLNIEEKKIYLMDSRSSRFHSKLHCLFLHFENMCDDGVVYVIVTRWFECNADVMSLCVDY